MFFPVRSNREVRSTPWVNYALIALNVVVFVLTMHQIAELDQLFRSIVSQQMQGLPVALPTNLTEQFPVYQYYFQPRDPQWYQFISYQFLHQGWMHLIGNMVFLFVFGNAVEDRLGKIGYLCFYLCGGILAAIGNMLMSDAAVLGASGSVAAVTGAYLALFPLTDILIVYWFGIIGAFEVSSIYLILFQVITDFVLNFTGTTNVAYFAHLSGYLFGFLLMMLFLSVRLLPREPYDMLAVVERRKRRKTFERMTQKGYSPWEGSLPTSTTGQADQELNAKQQQLMMMRQRIHQALSDHDLSTAAQAYREVLNQDNTQILSERHQLDLANQFMAEGDYSTAAHAYELMLNRYRRYPDEPKVHLILGLIYARYLDNPNRAKELLEVAASRLSEEDKQLAQSALDDLPDE